MKTGSKKQKNRFWDLDLSPDLVKVLDKLNFTTPTPIQQKAIPFALNRKDVIGIAQTGTGKTLAFTLPMLQSISAQNGTGLVVVPTRELAFQVREEIEKVGSKLGFRTALLIGGTNISQQIKALKRHPHVIIATPGRLIDHIDRRTVKLSTVRVLVLDEADRMLDMGFAPQINQILESVPNKRQTMLFSATMPDEISKMTHKYMNDPVRVEVAPQGTSAKNIEQGMYYITKENKLALLQELLGEHKNKPVLVFCRTKHGTRKMARTLKMQGFKTEELHSNRSLNQRRFELDNFKRGKCHIMVATDVAARGIDVKEIALVVNYDIPDKNEDYVHRIGRTGRAGHSGKAVSFVAPDQYHDMRAIEKLVGINIPVMHTDNTLEHEEIEKMKTRKAQKKSGGRGRRGGGGGWSKYKRPTRNFRGSRSKNQRTSRSR